MLLLKRRDPDQIARDRRDPVDAATLAEAKFIVDDVRARGRAALVEHAERLGDLKPGQAVVVDRAGLRRALEQLPASQRVLLESAAERISAFARAQRSCLKDFDMPVLGGVAGHRVAPVARAGCYAPGGRFPLPSSVLMTALTARASGVSEVIVASPRPALATLAAAALADADALLAVGGAQAIAALAYGAGQDLPPVDLIVGPGNRWATAAKMVVSGTVGIDMLAGPSEVLIIADAAADPRLIAADLLAQAEHDADAVPMLVTNSGLLLDTVEEELERQLVDLPTAAIARQALVNGFAAVVATIDKAIELSDRLAPEHLEIMTADSETVAARCKNYGAIFIGAASAEVFGDYGLGPNHVLPTAGCARFTAGLSVFTFLRCRTFLHVSPARGELNRLASETAEFARLEGLEAHARAAAARICR